MNPDEWWPEGSSAPNEPLMLGNLLFGPHSHAHSLLLRLGWGQMRWQHSEPLPRRGKTLTVARPKGDTRTHKWKILCKLFTAAPQLYAQIENRINLGNFQSLTALRGVGSGGHIWRAFANFNQFCQCVTGWYKSYGAHALKQLCQLIVVSIVEHPSYVKLHSAKVQSRVNTGRLTVVGKFFACCDWNIFFFFVDCHAWVWTAVNLQ